ncbi:MAG: glycine--tRNA ligase subunit beta [Burkholderiales bacterium]|nr:glycine--tRNA ligase subunit beta [Burkholderiales bacterium]
MSALTNENSLLIEFLSEELPPINLVDNIGCAFSQAVYAQLNGFVSATSQLRTFIAPRRFGCVIEGISFEQASQQMLRKGPALATGLKDGQVTPALLGFAKSCGCEWQDLQQRDDGYFYFAATIQGKSLDSVIENVINTALKKIHIAKAMRWGNSDYQFVRPVHNLIVKFNQQVLNCSALGLTANDTTLGHRFMSHAPIKIAHAADYLSQIYTEGKVVAEFNARRDVIEQQLNACAADLGLQISVMPGLLDEVCALVEWPEVLVGEFDEKFLAVPQECLILSMAKNQKYFALVDATGKLSNKFLFVANLISKNPQIIIEGNQKVLTARLADAEFFYEFDKRTPLKDFTAKMGSVVYHNKLGSQLERVQRLQQIAQAIAPLLNVDANLAFTSAYLLKADLASEMVGEFPELQGTMGKYYALASGETVEVANAIEQHYYPRFSGDKLPNSALATVMSLADKLESLVGIWGIGLIPTGDKDPYALRRAALGIVRILLEYKLDLEQLLVASFSAFTGKNLAPDTVCGVYEFIKQRLANYFISVENYSAKVVNAVLMQDKIDFAQVVNVCQAFSLWASSDANQALFEANKRIENILKKNSAELDASVVLSSNLFNAYEIELFAAVNKINPASSVQVYLEQLSELADPLTKFFANVMVMDEDLVVRKNRLKLLAEIYSKFNIYGKISELA